MHQCDAGKGGCSSFVLNITMKKLLLQRVGVHDTRGDVIMLITCYYYGSLRMFAKYISTYHLKVTSS